MTNGTLTEMERLKMENYSLRHSLLQGNLRDLIAERGAYIKQIEANHPGHVWDEQKGLVASEGAQD